MESKTKKQVQIRRRSRRAALVLAAVTIFLWATGESWFYVPLVLCLYFLAGAFIHPRIVSPMDTLVMWITLGLGWIISRLIMTFVFLFLILPIGLWFRLLGKDRLNLKFPDNADSYWHHRSPEEQVPRCDRQY